MRIVESRHHEMPTEIDHLRARPFQLENVLSLADGQDAIAAHSDGLRAPAGSERRCIRHAGVDISVDEDDIRLRAWVLILRLQHGKCGQQEQKRSDVHAPTPAKASKVRRIRFRPSSRPLQSNHSCKV